MGYLERAGYAMFEWPKIELDEEYSNAVRAFENEGGLVVDDSGRMSLNFSDFLGMLASQVSEHGIVYTPLDRNSFKL